MPDPTPHPECLIIVGAIFVVLFLCAWFAHQYSVSWTPESKLKKTMRLRTCDCGADTECPQGKNTATNPYKCKIWVEEFE